MSLELGVQGQMLPPAARAVALARKSEEAGFDAVWASGFEISASQAVPDANILSFSENLDIARAMAAAVGIPVIADCDNGFGNAVNVIRTVREYEAAGVERLMLQHNVFRDLDALELLAATVVPALS